MSTYEIIPAEKFDFSWLRQIAPVKRARGNPAGRGKGRVLNLVCAFDTETTTIMPEQQAVVYVWQWAFGPYHVVVGRTIQEWLDFAQKVCEALKPKDRLVTYVHNLSFDWQFMRGVYDFQPEEVFCMDSRKIAYCTMFDKKLEFRCSYIHSNMSLLEYTTKMHAEHVKLSGSEFDYSKTRYPWTPLTDAELSYCCHDVVGLVEAITNEMAADGDTLLSIPLTSTGYVRRDAKRAMHDIAPFVVRPILPDYQVYKMLRAAFRGGNTHANRYYSGLIVNNVHSFDRSSSYPDVQINCKFPMSKFFVEDGADIDRVTQLIHVRHRAVLFTIALHDVALADDSWGFPYIPRDKCRRIDRGQFDNGRVLSADYLEITVTDVDWEIIVSEYTWTDAVVIKCAHARYGFQPQPLRDCTIDYYRMKTELKGAPGQDVYYMKSKNKLNSIYGMEATNPCRDTIEFVSGEFRIKDEKDEDILRDSNRTAFLSYAWGVWVTAWARYRLEEGLRLVHEQGAVPIYCDTDSVKYIGDVDWDTYNAVREADSRKNGACAVDAKGTTHYMGVYEPDGDCDEFITLGAKKYAYTADGKIHLTVAGVGKRKGAEELQRAGGLRAFREGMVFRDAGGTMSVYNDVPNIEEKIIDGHRLEITPNIVILPSEYTLGITEEYRRCLQFASLREKPLKWLTDDINYDKL